MPYFALLYDTVDHFVERRQPYRAGHLAMIDDAYRSGRLVLAGALKTVASPQSPATNQESQPGALLVFRADDAADVEAFAKGDPYVLNGLVKRWRVAEWAVVVGENAVTR